MPVSLVVSDDPFENVIAVITKPVSMVTNVASIVKSGSDAAGYTYTYTNTAGTERANTANAKLAADTDGYLKAKFTGAASALQVILAISPANNSPSWNGTGRYGALFTTAGALRLTQGTTAGIVPNQAVVSYVEGIEVRLRREGATWFADVSTDGFETFTVAHEFVATSTVEMFPLLSVVGSVTGTAAIENVRVFPGIDL